MALNGLIFLIVVAIWAAYLVQYWIRRRDHLATARSMDRFSESMRVLARRSTLPRSSLETAPPLSYAVRPAHSMRPQILVKRADIRTSTSMLADDASARADSGDVGAAPVAPTSGRAAYGAASTPSGLAVATSSGPVARPRRGARRGARRVRGIVLLAMVVALLVVTVLAVVHAVTWWGSVVALVALGCAAVWVRNGVRAERSAGSRRGRSDAGHRRVRRPRSGALARAAEPIPQAADSPAQEGAHEADSVQPYGFEDPVPAPDPAVLPAVAQPTASLVGEDDIPLTWDPRPVPRPTYTMKARADRPSPPPADVTQAPVGVQDDDDVRAVEPARHTG